MNKPDNLIKFNELYTTHYERFVRFANSYVHDTDVAQDFTAESFIVLWDNMDGLKDDSNIKAYLLTTLKNKCLNYLRQQIRREEVHAELSEVSRWDLNMRITSLDSCVPEEIFSVEIQNIINATLQKLPQRTFQIFTANRYEGKSYKQIAESTGMTVKGVEFHISKALSLLRMALKDYTSALVFIYYFL